MTATVGVLALQGAFREHVRVLQSLGVNARMVRKGTDLDGLSGLVIPGGESTTMGLLMGEYGLLEPLSKGDLPIFGTCAGLILLASTIRDSDQPRLGLIDMEVERNAYGRQRESFEDDLEITGVGRVRAVFIRAPFVRSLGPKVEVIGHDRQGHIVAVRSGRHLALAFHPELAGERRVHELFVRSLKRPELPRADAKGQPAATRA